MWIRSLIVCSILVAGGSPILVSCAGKQARSPAPMATTRRVTLTTRPTLAATRPVDLAGVQNVVEYAEGIYSGAVPEGAEGFNTLRLLGIKSIISVDGTAPDVNLAHAAGFKYVHLPVTYGGISDERRVELARAIKELPKPLFIHCHHGKHRSAAATAIGLVGLGMMSPDDAVARMKVSGTAPTYKGLYQCVNLATVLNEDELSKADDHYVETMKTSGLVNTMVEVDDVFDHLKLIEKAGWQAPQHHPDLVPAAEAGRLADLMRIVKTDHDVLNRPAEFAEWLQTSSDQATSLEQSLAAGTVDHALAGRQFAAVTQSCKSCHVKYRD